MAKKDLQENVQAESEPVISVEEPSPVLELKQPLEKQEQVHEESANTPKPALQVGRPFVPSNNLLGEIDQLIYNAEQAGDKALIAELHALKVKVGDLLSHLHQLEQNAVTHVKPLYAKLIAFFRK